jgi:hypothetical protein
MIRNIFFAILLVSPLTAYAIEQMIPAGSLVQCTVSEPKLSSKTTDVGDPVLCQVGHVELYGRSVFPYGSYLEGRFEDYSDPGHFFGKGWMELKFDRMFIPPGRIIPVSAKVVYVPKYLVDKQGRIHGKGHPVRDTVEWLIPVLWPIDLINLPRRGPRPELKAETRLTLKIMDDFGVPMPEQAAIPQNPAPNVPANPYGFSQRVPMTYPMPVAPPPLYPPVNYGYPPPPPPLTMLMLRDGFRRLAADYWFEGGGQVQYVSLRGNVVTIPMGMLDVPATVVANRSRGVEFTIRPAAY